MEDNNKLTPDSEQGNSTDSGSSSGQMGGNRTYSQSQVEDIIKGRLAKMRRQAESEAAAAYEQKSAELHQRELALLTREKLTERGMPLELAGVISCTDEKDLSQKLDVLQKLYSNGGSDADTSGSGKPAGTGAGFSVGSVQQKEAGGGVFVADPVRSAMGLNRKG